MNELLANYCAGRILLHAVCLLRHPRHAHWHWCGIVRELQPAARLKRLRVSGRAGG